MTRSGRIVAATLLLAALLFMLVSSVRAADGRDDNRCADARPICHIAQVPLCICDSAWRKSCTWHCVSSR